MTFVKRTDKVMFMEGITDTFNRMKGFISLATNKNPKEYTRQYVDDDFETTDVVAISVSTDFTFDQKADDLVHTKMTDIIDNEKIGDDAVVDLLQVDFTNAGTGVDTFVAIKRAFVVVPGSEGGSNDAYTYSGTFKVKGEKIMGEATTTDGWKTCTFTPDAV